MFSALLISAFLDPEQFVQGTGRILIIFLFDGIGFGWLWNAVLLMFFGARVGLLFDFF